jgi:hypothetical protein
VSNPAPDPCESTKEEVSVSCSRFIAIAIHPCRGLITLHS